MLFGATLLALTTSLNAATVAGEKPVPQTLFKNVTIYKGIENKLYVNHQVLIEGNLIQAISAEDIQTRDDATVIGGGGRTPMPGLSDSHTHPSLVAPLAERGEMDWGEISTRMTVVAEDQLMRGFNTVRDLYGNTHGLRNAKRLH